LPAAAARRVFVVGGGATNLAAARRDWLSALVAEATCMPVAWRITHTHTRSISFLFWS